jgi:hypothetical protein
MAYQPAICGNHRYKILPKTRRKLTDRQQTNNLARYIFTKIYEKAFCFCGHNILREGVFVPQLPSNAGISV